MNVDEMKKYVRMQVAFCSFFLSDIFTWLTKSFFLQFGIDFEREHECHALLLHKPSVHEAETRDGHVYHQFNL